MMNSFKKAVAATLVVGCVAVPSTSVMAMGPQAQPRDRYEDQRDRDRDRDYRDRDQDRDRYRDRDRDRDRRDRREWRRYDYNHFEPGYRHYDAARYYVWDDRSYRERRLGRYDRVYRGYDGRYYCRRSDGTTGLIVGGISGATLGGVLTRGDSKPLGAILGGVAGAVIGRSIDRNNIVCR